MSVLQHNQILGCRGATLLQGEMTPLCWTQQGPIYFTELGYPPPDPDSINLAAAAAAAGGRVGFALTTYLPVQLEIEEYSSNVIQRISRSVPSPVRPTAELQRFCLSFYRIIVK